MTANLEINSESERARERPSKPQRARGRGSLSQSDLLQTDDFDSWTSSLAMMASVDLVLGQAVHPWKLRN